MRGTFHDGGVVVLWCFELTYQRFHFLQLEQFYTTLNDELDKYKTMENFLIQQSGSIELVATTVSNPPDHNYIKEQAARVDAKFV